MKTYIVTTRDLLNPHSLHSSLNTANIEIFGKRGVEYFSTDNIDEARRVFSLEVSQLQSEDRRSEITDPYFDFTTHNPSSAVTCKIIEEVYGDDGEVADVVVIENSEYFYIPA